jgi:hypothetical protein
MFGAAPARGEAAYHRCDGVDANALTIGPRQLSRNRAARSIK